MEIAGLKFDLLAILKWVLVGVFFSLFLVAIGNVMFSPPEFYPVLYDGYQQKFVFGDTFVYNLTSNNTSIELKYVFDGERCFYIYFMNGSYAGISCRTNFTYPFPFLAVIPKEVDRPARFVVVSSFSSKNTTLDEYIMYPQGVDKRGRKTYLFLRDSNNYTYVVERTKGYIVFANYSDLEAYLINKN